MPKRVVPRIRRTSRRTRASRRRPITERDPPEHSQATARARFRLCAGRDDRGRRVFQQRQRWEEQFQSVAQKGRALWTDGKLGTNGVACAQCHPNAANTHPETYPKFQKQLGKVANLWEMINWCLRNPLEGEPMAADDPRMVAMISYATWERRGVALDPGKH